MENEFETLSKEEQELHKILDQKIDIKKPLLSQVKKLTNKEFLAFVKRPRYMESSDGIQIFDTKEEDESRKTVYSTNIKVMTPVIIAFIIGSYADCESNSEFVRTFLIWFSWGLIVIWTLMEYV
jgi:hypothetical protein